MKKLLFVLLTVPGLASAAVLKETALDQEINDVLTICDEAIGILSEADESASEVIACPKVEQYSYKKTTRVSKVLKELNESYSLKSTDAVAAAENINDKLDDLYNIIKDFWIDDDSIAKEASKTFTKFSNKLIAVIRSKGETAGAASYIDPDTYWAPSVNAKATVIINSKSRKVYVFLAGDADG